MIKSQLFLPDNDSMTDGRYTASTERRSKMSTLARNNRYASSNEYIHQRIQSNSPHIKIDNKP